MPSMSAGAKMSYILGLTGGIGMGKSTLSTYLKTLGFCVLDADQIARKVVKKGTPGLRRLVQTFGQKILTPEGDLDRTILGKIVFDDPKMLAKLNTVMIPLIKAEDLTQIAHAKSAKVIVLDAPLLFEQGYDELCDAVVTVSLPQTLQIKRIMARDHLAKEDALARIKHQLPDEIRRKKATVVLDSSGTVEETRAQMIKWLKTNHLIER